MSREWFAVHGRIVRTPKFRKLPDSAQLTLIYLWSIAGDQTPEATWRSAEELADGLELAGRANAAQDVDELHRRGWLDVLDDGRVAVHDWDEHQVAASVAVRRDWEASRKAAWRNKRHADRDDSPVRDLSGTGPGLVALTEQETRGQEARGQEKPTPLPEAPRATSHSSTPVTLTREQFEAWTAFGPEWNAYKAAALDRGFRSPPGPKQRDMLWPIVDARPNDVARWLREAPGKSHRDAIDHVLSKWAAIRASAEDEPYDAGPTPDEAREAWTKLGEVLRSGAHADATG